MNRFDGPATYMFQAAEKHFSRTARRRTISETHSFLNHNRSCSAIKKLLKRDRMASFLTDNFSYQEKKAVFPIPTSKKTFCLLQRKELRQIGPETRRFCTSNSEMHERLPVKKRIELVKQQSVSDD